jgi:glutamate 5-kinase
MNEAIRYRQAIADARRVVVKIGTRALVQRSGRPDVRRMRSLVREIAQLQRRGCEVAVVTSGAIGAGMEALGMKARPTELPELQMAAAVGQCRLMARYSELFGAAGRRVGQVLLTHADFHHKVRLVNARRTLESLLRHHVIPIVNENDVVADEEIKADLALGDNDLLASLLVRMIRADLLILLSTVEGVLEVGASGRARRLPVIEEITRKTFELVQRHDSRLSKGGMASKLRAAQSAARAGCSVVIANGRRSGVLTSIVRGEDTGTLVVASAL